MWDSAIINLDEAMERVLGHKDMYIRWLKKFFVPETMGEVESAFEKKDYDLCHRAVHKLKGTSANLAITALSAQAMLLDEKVKAGEPFENMTEDYDKLFCDFRAALDMFESNITELENYPV